MIARGRSSTAAITPAASGYARSLSLTVRVSSRRESTNGRMQPIV